MLAPIITTIDEVRAVRETLRGEKKTIGFVPTMGALHEGHASLIRAARAATEFVVVSIFVNPTQFGPKEDYTRYPRTLEDDQKLATEAGADLIFAPGVEEMYPGHPRTAVEVRELDAVLEGPARPGHFRGVCTVVLKLFNIVEPHIAYFGAKDFQQFRIIQQMVLDLNLPVKIGVQPTVREADGLAMSSRNRYLSPGDRKAAGGIHQALKRLRSRARAGEIDVARLESALAAELGAIPGARVDYARILDADSLRPLSRLDRRAVAAVAVYFGKTRLIDNVILSHHPKGD